MNTAILILNWNGGRDTIACLQSLLPHLGAQDYLFLIDNGSTDTSVSEIESYLTAGGNSYLSTTPAELKSAVQLSQKIYLVRNAKNLGFGGGNNTVLKQLLNLSIVFELAWLLNNDARVKPQSLQSLKTAFTKSSVAVAGSLILNEPDGSSVQCSGVNYYKWLGVSRLINKNLTLDQLNKKEPIAFDYLNGASLMFKLNALDKAGYFDERFFLYSEEQDLQLRLQHLGYSLFLNLDSEVIHALSGGTSSKKHLFYYYYNLSALLLSKKHFSFVCNLSAVLSLSAITFVRTFPSLKNFGWGIKGIFTGITTRI